MKLEFSWQIFEKYSIITFHENSSSGSPVVLWGWTDRRTDMTKLIVAFSDFANAPKTVFCNILPSSPRSSKLSPNISPQELCVNFSPLLPLLWCMCPGHLVILDLMLFEYCQLWSLSYVIFFVFLIAGSIGCSMLIMGVSVSPDKNWIYETSLGVSNTRISK